MGWLFSWDWSDRKAVVEHIVNDVKASGRYVDHSSTGNELYVVMRNNADDGQFIMCCRLKGGKQDGWGYKDMDESMGPFMYNCPERILKQSTCQHEHSIEWRERCRMIRKEKNEVGKLLNSLKPYDKVETPRFGILEFLYVARGFVCMNEKGQVFRYAKKYFVGAKLVK